MLAQVQLTWLMITLCVLQSLSIDAEPSNVDAIAEALVPFDTLGVSQLYLKQFVDGVEKLGAVMS